MAAVGLNNNKKALPLVFLLLLILEWRIKWMTLQANSPTNRITANESAILDEHPPRPRVKVAKATVAVEALNGSAIARALQTHRVHNEMHGYEHFIGNSTLVLDSPTPDYRSQGTWSKPAYISHIILDELNKPEADRLEWVFWFDADTIIMNPHVALETFIPPKSLPASAGIDPSHIHLLLASNWDGINAGVLLLRVHPWTVSLLATVTGYPHLNPYNHLQFMDQSALWTLLSDNESFKHNYTIVPQRWFNSCAAKGAFDPDGRWVFGDPMTPDQFDDGEEYQEADETPTWKILKGDMCVHFAGAVDRASWMNPWADRAEMYLPEWSSSVYQTRLEQEAKDFWEVKEPNRRKLEAELARLREEEEARRKIEEERARVEEAERKKAEEERLRLEQEKRKLEEEMKKAKEQMQKAEEEMRKAQLKITGVTSIHNNPEEGSQQQALGVQGDQPQMSATMLGQQEASVAEGGQQQLQTAADIQPGIPMADGSHQAAAIIDDGPNWN